MDYFTEILYSNDTVIHESTVIVAHNAFANPLEGSYHLHNQQQIDLQQQLELGARGFMLDLHDYQQDIYLCHEACDAKVMQLAQRAHGSMLPYQTFADWLSQYKEFLDKKPFEIIFLFLESYVNVQRIVNTLDTVDLLKNVYNQDINKRVTFGDLRQQSKNLVIFSDYQYERNHHYSNFQLPQIRPTSEIKETKYALERDDQCGMRLDFRADPSDSKVQTFMMNHFAEISNNKINEPHYIMNRTAICIGLYGYPTFIAGDFIETQGESTIFQKIALSIDLAKSKKISVFTSETRNGQYSHVESVFDWVSQSLAKTQSGNLCSWINFAVIASVDKLLYMFESNIALGIANLSPPRNHVHRDELMPHTIHFSQKIAHVIAKTGVLYNAYKANNLLFTTSLLTLSFLYWKGRTHV